VFVVLTPALPDGELELSPFVSQKRMRYVDIGQSQVGWDKLDADQQHDLLVDLTVAALGKVSGAAFATIVADVAAQLKAQKSEIEITAKSHDTSSYLVRVTYQVTPNRGPSLAFLSCLDKKSGDHGRTLLTELKISDHIYSLCGEISVKNGNIVVRPRKSFKASIISENYSVPFVAPINSLLSHENDLTG